MNLLSAEDLSKSYGERVLFSGLTLGISEGQKIAFVAKNGTGKTSLLNILAGLDVPDSGEVTMRKGTRLSYLDQDPNLNPESSILEEVLNAENEQLVAILAYEKALKNPDDAKAYQAAFDQMDIAEAWDYEQSVKQILSKLKLDMMERKIETLSGGEKKRIALAKVLIQKPDILVMDEPTNHLDLEMIEWLEGYIKAAGFALFMVTHDRYFLENICDEILELDRGQLFKYKGNFSYFLEQKQARKENEIANVGRAKNLMRKELEWMRRQPKARTTKSKARIDAFYDLKKVASKNLKEDELELNVKMTRLGSKILELKNVCKSYGEKAILDKFTYSFKKGEKVGIIGQNGSGKTTFLKLILEQEKYDAGKIILGETVKFGYYSQDGIKIKDGKRVIEVIKDIAEYIPMSKGKKITAGQLLEKFLFDRDHQYSYVSKLSGGERKRLYLLTILMANPNFLILDEPTNDLDIMTLNVLEEFLSEYEGCLIIVSHDRFFLDKVVDQLLVFEGAGKLKGYNGNYSQYRETVANVKKKKVKQEVDGGAPDKPQTEKVKLTFKEKIEFENLSNRIEEIEVRRQHITKLFESDNEEDVNYDSLSREMNELVNELDSCEMRWLELSEYL